jgi:hypothetical protein
MVAFATMLSSKRLFLIAVFACACGGKTSGESGDAGGTPHDGSPGGPDVMGDDIDASRPPVDAQVVDAVVVQPDAGLVTCNPGGGGGSGGPNSCSIMVTESCSDGNNYQVTCECPASKCQCSGSSGGVVLLTTCPQCPSPDEAFTICGFPH